MTTAQALPAPRFVSRDEWGARPHRAGPGRLNPADVEGIAFHWPGISTPIHGLNNVKAALRGWQNFHMDDRGWSDIAYQQIIDQDGNRYQGRGLGIQSGANGDEFVNETWGAILLVLAPGERPTPAMLSTIRRTVQRNRELFPASKVLTGHQNVRNGPTDCPGSVVEQYLKAGRFEPHKPWSPKPLRRQITKALAIAEEAPDKTPGIIKTRLRLNRALAILERKN